MWVGHSCPAQLMLTNRRAFKPWLACRDLSDKSVRPTRTSLKFLKTCNLEGRNQKSELSSYESPASKRKYPDVGRSPRSCGGASPGTARSRCPRGGNSRPRCG